MTEAQRSAILSDYYYGKKYNVGWTLASINWAESSGCKYQIYKQQYGCYHQHIIYYLLDYSLKDNRYTKSYYATKLVTDKEFARLTAVNKLLKLKMQYRTWHRTIGAYNGTSNLTTNKYQRRIYKYMRFLKKIIKRQ